MDYLALVVVIWLNGTYGWYLEANPTRYTESECKVIVSYMLSVTQIRLALSGTDYRKLTPTCMDFDKAIRDGIIENGTAPIHIRASSY